MTPDHINGTYSLRAATPNFMNIYFLLPNCTFVDLLSRLH